jgi:hypothetical protein
MDTGEMIRRNTATREATPQSGVARVVVAAMAFGLLTALWVVLWVPSAPVL